MKLTSKDKAFNIHYSLPCISLNVNSENLAVHQEPSLFDNTSIVQGEFRCSKEDKPSKHPAHAVSVPHRYHI